MAGVLKKMSEKLNDNFEQASGSDNSGATKYPSFDPEAANAFRAGDFDSAREILGRAKEEREAADRAEEEAGEFYEQMKNP